MRIGDIVGIFLFCTVIMLPLGYFMRDWLPRFRQWWSALLLSPRYLKSEGVRRRKPIPPAADEQDE